MNKRTKNIDDTKKIYKVVLILLFIIATSQGCLYKKSNYEDINRKDVLGRWEANYVDASHIDTLDPTGKETIIFYSNGKYKQIYENDHGYFYESQLYNWHYDRGLEVIFLEQGRWYPKGVVKAEDIANDNTSCIASISVKEERISLFLEEEIILFVYPLGGELILAHMRVGDADGLGQVFLKKIEDK
jgi:hypothetical protein